MMVPIIARKQFAHFYLRAKIYIRSAIRSARPQGRISNPGYAVSIIYAIIIPKALILFYGSCMHSSVHVAQSIIFC